MTCNVTKIRGKWFVVRLLPNQPADTWTMVRSKGFATEGEALAYAERYSK